jgi:hypothetical protein
MIKSAEKSSKPSASNSLNPKQMQMSRFGPGPVEVSEAEHEAPAGGAPLFSYNLMNLPASPEAPAVQCKEPEDEEIQMKPSCPECEEEIQAKFIGEGIVPTVQRQTDPDSEEEEVLQGKFLPIQRVNEDEEIQAKPMGGSLTSIVQREAGLQGHEPEEEEGELLQSKMAENIQRQPEFDDEEELIQGKFAPGPTGIIQAERERSPNRTGMPDHLKSGIETLSGIDLSSVRVHHNSPKPAKINALAYTQGFDIHIAPGQEQHLPHEVWHAVQQAQGRVKPTMQLMEGIPVNDDDSLEHEADIMGEDVLANSTPFKDKPEEQPQRGFVPMQRTGWGQGGLRLKKFDFGEIRSDCSNYSFGPNIAAMGRVAQLVRTVSGSIPLNEIPDELKMGMSRGISEDQNAQRLFSNIINNLNFTYMGRYSSPIGALNNCQGDCRTLQEIFGLVANAYGIGYDLKDISPTDLGDGDEPGLVNSAPILGDVRSGNTDTSKDNAQLKWLFKEHHWVQLTSNGVEYDLLFKSSPKPNIIKTNGFARYKDKLYLKYPGNYFVITPTMAMMNKFKYQIEEGTEGIVFNNEDNLKMFIKTATSRQNCACQIL